MNFVESLSENPIYLISLFVAVLILFLLGFIISKRISSKKKKALLGTGNRAEIRFDETIRSASKVFTDKQFQGYKIFSVNGNEPEIVDKSIFVPAGLCKIELQYLDTDYTTRRISNTKTYQKELLEIDAVAGKSYKASFDENTGITLK